MASLPFTLAALATSAVPGLTVTGVAALDDDPDYSSAAIETDRGPAVVRVPRSASAEVRQSAEMLGLAALGEGARAELGFAVPETLGVTRAGETRATVFTRLPGNRLTPDDLASSGTLLGGIAEMLAAVHALPPSTVLQGGLSARDARECRAAAARIIARAEDTRMLPETVLQRWDRAMSDDDTWDFAAAVVHGSLEPEAIHAEDERIVGVDGWSELSVGDPAADLSWLIEIDPEVFGAVIPRYSRLHPAGSLPALRLRARLYQELRIAERLLQGVERHDQGRIDESIAELDRLVDLLSMHPEDPGLAAATSATAAVSAEQVESILSATPEVVDRLSETAAQEALDEDRMFGVDTDFVEPLSADGEDGEAGAADAQLTEPLSEEDLPRNEPG